MEPDQIEKAIEQIRLLSNAQVDYGTGQGPDRFFAQLRNHSSTPEMLELPFDWHVEVRFMASNAYKKLIEVKDGE
jgi:hypothetical protein